MLKLPRLLHPTNSTGAKGEAQALAYLKAQGLQLICQNYFCRFGEIDIIMSDNDSLVFVEVRYRKNSHYGGALASITPRKQQKIITTAKHYLSQLSNEPCCRFDVVVINGEDQQLQWITGAFSE